MNRSTICRELKRNKTEKRGVYNHKTAQMYANERKKWKTISRKFVSSMQCQFVKYLTEFRWSPEQIVGRLRLEGKQMVGKTTLYTFLHKDKKAGGNLFAYCPHALKYRKQRLSTMPASRWAKRKSIEQRPEVINTQERMGDFEMDTIIGKGKSVLQTIVDRKTDFAIIQKLGSGKDAKKLAKAVKKRLAYLKRRGQLHSLTTDNGTEFTYFKSIERALNVPVFFAKPYCSSDKPHIEHLNKLIRQYLPKRSSFDNLTDKDIAEIECSLNNKPRKKLGYKNPFEVFWLNL